MAIKRVVTESEVTGGVGSNEVKGWFPEVNGRSRPLGEHQSAERT